MWPSISSGKYVKDINLAIVYSIVWDSSTKCWMLASIKNYFFCFSFSGKSLILLVPVILSWLLSWSHYFTFVTNGIYFRFFFLISNGMKLRCNYLLLSSCWLDKLWSRLLPFSLDFSMLKSSLFIVADNSLAYKGSSVQWKLNHESLGFYAEVPLTIPLFFLKFHFVQFSLLLIWSSRDASGVSYGMGRALAVRGVVVKDKVYHNLKFTELQNLGASTVGCVEVLHCFFFAEVVIISQISEF